MAEITKKSSPMLVALAWAVVAIPLTWGVYNTALNAAKLFTSTPPAVSTAAQAK